MDIYRAISGTFRVQMGTGLDRQRSGKNRAVNNNSMILAVFTAGINPDFLKLTDHVLVNYPAEEFPAQLVFVDPDNQGLVTQRNELMQ